MCQNLPGQMEAKWMRRRKYKRFREKEEREAQIKSLLVFFFFPLPLFSIFILQSSSFYYYWSLIVCSVIRQSANLFCNYSNKRKKAIKPSWMYMCEETFLAKLRLKISQFILFDHSLRKCNFHSKTEQLTHIHNVLGEIRRWWHPPTSTNFKQKSTFTGKSHNTFHVVHRVK